MKGLWRPLPRDSTALVILLGCATALGPLSTDMYLPSLPALAAIYGTDAASVQLTLSAFLAGFAVTQLIYGPVSTASAADRPCCSALRCSRWPPLAAPSRPAWNG